MKPFTAATVLAFAFSAAGAVAQPSPSAPQAAPAPQSPLGPQLWNGARVGMPVAQVQALFPVAAGGKGEVRADGSQADLTLPASIGGGAATAKFYFNADGLTAVIFLDRSDVAVGHTPENLTKAHAVEAELEGDYGQPRTCSEQPRLAALTCDWEADARRIVLSYRDVGGATPSLSVVYRTLSDKNAWKPSVPSHKRH